MLLPPMNNMLINTHDVPPEHVQWGDVVSFSTHMSFLRNGGRLNLIVYIHKRSLRNLHRGLIVPEGHPVGRKIIIVKAAFLQNEGINEMVFLLPTYRSSGTGPSKFENV